LLCSRQGTPLLVIAGRILWADVPNTFLHFLSPEGLVAFQTVGGSVLLALVVAPLVFGWLYKPLCLSRRLCGSRRPFHRTRICPYPIFGCLPTAFSLTSAEVTDRPSHLLGFGPPARCQLGSSSRRPIPSRSLSSPSFFSSLHSSDFFGRGHKYLRLTFWSGDRSCWIVP